MGSPAGSSGTGTGSTANVYTPANQPAADTKLTDYINSYPSSISSTPAGTYYGAAQDALSTYFADPKTQTAATGGADTTYNYQVNTAFPEATSASTSLYDYGGKALSYGFDPQYTANVTAAENNPYYGTALSGAQTAADIGTTGAKSLASDANQTLSTAYDPQNALYRQGQGTALDYANVTNAASGLSGTPYGSSVAANALSNYDLNWQDKQLGRQEKALSSADTAISDASKLAYTSSGYPSKVYTGNIDEINKTLAARNTGASVGGATGTALDTAGQTIADTATTALDTATYYPYKVATQIGSNYLTGINDVTNLGNDQYTLPQQAIQDLESYLKLGQSASTISGQLGSLGLSELGTAASGIGGLASGASSLFGGGSSSSGSGLFSSLFGSGASTAADYGGGGAALGVADSLGTAAADTGGASALTAALPLLAS